MFGGIAVNLLDAQRSSLAQPAPEIGAHVLLESLVVVVADDFEGCDWKARSIEKPSGGGPGGKSLYATIGAFEIASR